MIHPDIQAMLVRERSATLLAAAAAYRRGRQARAAAMAASRAAASGTAGCGTAASRTAERSQVVLRDGSAVLIRPVRSTDAPLLADGSVSAETWQSLRMRLSKVSVINVSIFRGVRRFRGNAGAGLGGRKTAAAGRLEDGGVRADVAIRARGGG